MEADAVRLFFQSIDPGLGIWEQLPGLGVGGILAGIMFWAFRNVVESAHKRETDLLKELAQVKTDAAERVTRNEQETRATLAQLLIRSIEVQDKTNQSQIAVATALTELNGVVKSLADVKALTERLGSLERELHVSGRKTSVK